MSTQLTEYINPLMYGLTISDCEFCIYRILSFSLETAFISKNSENKMIFVMVKCGVLFTVRPEFLNIISHQHLLSYYRAK